MKQLIFLFLMLSSSLAFAQLLPEKNKQIIAFCESNKGKKVGKGECWDLANAALDKAAANWTKPYGFGRELGKKEKPLPGDIIQFEDVKIEYEDGSGQSLPHHTAVIYQVHEDRKFTIAEQNSNNRRFVVFSEIDLKFMKKGRYKIYRPE